jgi:glycosyltransferase involved in cell wall biosynthesis
MPATSVLLLVRELDIGGCERDLARTAVGLQGDPEFLPLVGCFRDQGLRRPELDRAGIELVRFHVPSFRSWRLLPAIAHLRRFIRERNVRLVHAWDIPSSMFLTLAKPFLDRVKTLSAQLSHRDLVTPMEQRIMNRGDRILDGVVVNSRAVGEDLIRHYGTTPDRLRLLYNGVDLERFHPAPPPPAPHPQLAGAGLVVGTVCALRPEKRVDLLIRAFAAAFAQRADTRLLILGSGPEKPLLERLLAESPAIAGRTILIPATPEVEVWMRAMHIFVSTSNSESFSNSLLEAMASGCCVVTTAAGGNVEMVEDYRSGFVIPIGDIPALTAVLERLGSDPRLRQTMAAAAQQRARQEFSLTVNLQKTKALYRHYCFGSPLPPDALFNRGSRA